MKKIIIALLACAAAISGNAAVKYAGGDISLLTKYEEHGSQYYTADGTAITSVLDYFKEQGWNALRVRLFVNPDNADDSDKGEGVVQDLDYVKALGKRIKDAGFALMLDFHYSDTWADPSNQWTPADWTSLSVNETYTKIYDYTKEVLEAMTAAGATPDFIQTGNEISYGMMWGVSTASSSSLRKCYTSSTTNWPYFTSLLSNAVKACRETCPQAKIVIHTERVANTSVMTAFYNNMATYGIDYDIIGLSYYPYYHGYLPQLQTALEELKSNFAAKEVMIVETGYPYAWSMPNTEYDYTSTYAYSDEGQKAFTDDLITLLNKYEQVTGLFWWFPEANEYGLDWSTNRVTDGWYNASLVDNRTGRFGTATSSLKNFINDPAGIQGVNSESTKTASQAYSIAGQSLQQPAQGLNIIQDTYKSTDGTITKKARKVIR